MSVYSIPVTIGVDEDRIAKEIENDVENRIVDSILNKVEKSIFQKRNYYDGSEPIHSIVREEVGKLLIKHEQDIIKEAAKLCSEKLMRTKAVKEAAAEYTKKNT